MKLKVYPVYESFTYINDPTDWSEKTLIGLYHARADAIHYAKDVRAFGNRVIKEERGRSSGRYRIEFEDADAGYDHVQTIRLEVGRPMYVE